MVYRNRLRTSRSLNDSSSAAKEKATGLDTLGSLTSHHWSWDDGTNLLWVKAHGNKRIGSKQSFSFKQQWLFRKQWLLLKTMREPEDSVSEEQNYANTPPLWLYSCGTSESKNLCQNTFFPIRKANFIMTPNVN